MGFALRAFLNDNWSNTFYLNSRKLLFSKIPRTSVRLLPQSTAWKCGNPGLLTPETEPSIEQVLGLPGPDTCNPKVTKTKSGKIHGDPHARMGRSTKPYSEKVATEGRHQQAKPGGGRKVQFHLISLRWDVRYSWNQRHKAIDCLVESVQWQGESCWDLRVGPHIKHKRIVLPVFGNVGV